MVHGRFGVVRLGIVPAGEEEEWWRGGECQVVVPENLKKSREQGRKVLNRRPRSSRTRPHSSAQLVFAEDRLRAPRIGILDLIS